MKSVLILAAAASVPFYARTGPAPTAPRAAPASPARTAVPDEDARRAAAGRLLAASHFRERQAVLIKDGLRAAEAEMAEACMERAAAGRDMKTCEAVAAPGPEMKARLAAAESNMLDEIMVASQTVYAKRFTAAEMDEITRFFRTTVGQHYAQVYPEILSDVQQRKRVILRRYLTAAATPGKGPTP